MNVQTILPELVTAQRGPHATAVALPVMRRVTQPSAITVGIRPGLITCILCILVEGAARGLLSGPLRGNKRVRMSPAGMGNSRLPTAGGQLCYPAMKGVNSDVAYTFIRDRILDGEYLPGHPLITNALSTRIGVSRTPVRDALRQLEADGLVSIRARQGASVKKLTVKELQEVCTLRLALESYAAGMAATHRTDVDLLKINRALTTMREVTERLEKAASPASLFAEFVREDVRFHLAIIGAAKHELIKKEILRLHLINRVVFGLLPGKDNTTAPADPGSEQAERLHVIASHEQIFQAIRKNEVAGARSAMERHLQEIIDVNFRNLVNDQNATNEEEEEERIYAS